MEDCLRGDCFVPKYGYHAKCYHLVHPHDENIACEEFWCRVDSDFRFTENNYMGM